MKHKKFSIFGLVKGIASDYIERFRNLTELASLEAKVAYHYTCKVIVIGVICAIVGLSTWLSLLFFIYTLLLFFNLIPLAAVGIVLGLNLIILLILGFWLKSAKNHIGFDATKRQLKRLSDH